MADDPGELAQHRALVQCFVDAVRAGMFCTTGHKPSSCLAELTVSDAGQHVPIQLTAENLDPAAVNVLIAMLKSFAAAPGRRFTAAERIATETAPDLGDRSAATPRYPPLHEGLPYEVDVELPDESLEPVTLRLHFAAPLTDARYAAIGALVSLWVDLIERKAFSAHLVDDASEFALLNHETYLLAPDQVETVVYGLDADPAAFDALMNALSKAAPDAPRLVRLELW